MTFAYFIGPFPDGPIKIGATTDVLSRWKTLCTESPVALRVHGVSAGGFARERELHRQFRRFRMHGEWFELSDEIREYIANHCEPWTHPDPKPRIDRQRKTDGQLAAFACTMHYKQWLIDLVKSERSSLIKLAHEGLTISASRHGYPGPPPLGKTRFCNRMAVGPTFALNYSPEWREWLVGFCDQQESTISSMVRTGFAVIAEERGRPEPPGY